MGLADYLSGETEPCEAAAGCVNQPVIGTPSVCGDCRFAKRFGGRFNRWVSIKPGVKHPQVVEEQLAAKRSQAAEKQTKLRDRDRGKMRVQSLARQAERQTNRNIIRATKNSGRTNKDADHVMAGKITLDTKLQTKVLNPVVKVAELEKCRQDARRAGNSIGALVLRNENGHGFVVLAEEDFALMVLELR